MKLIDLLVQELPKRGGWPLGVNSISTHADGMVFFDGKIQNNRFDGVYCSNGWRPGMPHGYTNAVQREQYEIALAKSKQYEWDGEGLPPVGCECKVLYDTCEKSWYRAKIIAYDGKHIIGRWLEGPKTNQILDYFVIDNFRPIRTEAEAERKRDESIKELDSVYKAIPHSDAVAYVLYDAIAAGNIKGLKVE